MLFGSDDKPLSGEPETRRDISITRSFSFKVNLGNYESADFFCSQRAECDASLAEEVSRDLDEFCQDEVRKAIQQFKENRARKQAASERKVA